MEHLLQLDVLNPDIAARVKFQSLFLWNIYFNLTPLEVPSQCKSVSILIFMEHLLQPEIELGKRGCG